jgi:ATP-binding cassette, subfamily B, bacterial PglK
MKPRLPSGVTNGFGMWQVMSPARRRQALLQLALQCVSNFFEVMVLGLIVPLVAVVNDPALIQRSRLLRWAYRTSGAPDAPTFMLGFGGLLLFLLVLRAVLSTWSNRRMRTLCSAFATELGAQVLDRVLHLPYLEQVRVNSSVFARLSTSDVDRAAMQSLVTFFTILSESFTAGTVLLGLIVVNPLLMIPLIILLSLGAYFAYRRTNRQLAEAGQHMRAEQAVVNKWVLQSLGDVRYARLVGSENFFVSKVADSWRRYAVASQTSVTIQQGTRVYFETGVLAGVILMVMYFVGSSSAGEILTVLGLLAVAAVRLIPSINRVINGAQILNHIRASIDGVVEILSRKPALEATGLVHAIPFSGDVKFRDISFTYPGKPRPALDGISFAIRKGEMIGIVGPSGAGKSTVIDILCGLIPPDSGQVLVDGFDVQGDLRGWQSLIGYVPQTVFLLDDTIRANIAYGVPAHEVDNDAVQRALETAALAPLVATLPEGVDTNVGERGVALSGGQRQRIAIARALYRNAPILVLDEATSALDSATEREITETLRNIYGKKTVVVIAHRLNTVKEADHIYLLEEGRLVSSGTFAELEVNSALFRRIGALG